MVKLFMIKRGLSKSRSLFLDQATFMRSHFFIIKVEVAPIKIRLILLISRELFILERALFDDHPKLFKIEVGFLRSWCLFQD